MQTQINIIRQCIQKNTGLANTDKWNIFNWLAMNAWICSTQDKNGLGKPGPVN